MSQSISALIDLRSSLKAGALADRLVVVTDLTGSPDVRERLRLAEAGELGEAEAVWLGADIDALAGLLASR